MLNLRKLSVKVCDLTWMRWLVLKRATINFLRMKKMSLLMIIRMRILVRAISCWIIIMWEQTRINQDLEMNMIKTLQVHLLTMSIILMLNFRTWEEISNTWTFNKTKKTSTMKMSRLITNTMITIGIRIMTFNQSPSLKIPLKMGLNKCIWNISLVIKNKLKTSNTQKIIMIKSNNINNRDQFISLKFHFHHIKITSLQINHNFIIAIIIIKIMAIAVINLFSMKSIKSRERSKIFKEA